MAKVLYRLRFPAAASLLLMLPYVLMETARRRPPEAFPYAVFAILWLLQVAFMLLLKPVLQTVRPGRPGTQPGWLFLSAVCLVLIGWLWASVMVDQIPCFLGVPDCD